MAVNVCVDSQFSSYIEVAANDGRLGGMLLEVPILKEEKVKASVIFENSYSLYVVVY